MSSYKEEYEWRKLAMSRLRGKLAKAPNMKVFNQIMKAFAAHVDELIKIDYITRSPRTW